MADETVLKPEIEKLLQRIEGMLGSQKLENPDKFNECCGTLFEYAVSEQSDELFAKYYSILLEKVRLAGDYSTVENDALKGIEYQKKAGEYGLVVKSYMYLYMNAERTGNISKAAQYIYYGLAIAEDHALYSETARLATCLGYLYYKAGDYANSIKYCLKAEENAEMAFDWDSESPETGELILNTANAFLANNRLYDAAKQKQKLAQYENNAIEKGIEYPRFLFEVFYAGFYMRSDEQDKVNEHLTKAKEVLDSVTDIAQYDDSITNYLAILSSMEKYDEMGEVLDFFIDKCKRNREMFKTAKPFFMKKIDLSLLKDDHETALETCIELISLYERSEQSLQEQIREAKDIFTERIGIERVQEDILKRNEKLREGIERANSENAAKSAFISSMSHEIRTPINAVLGLDEMIIRETGEESVRNYAYDIRNAGKNLLSIVNDILDFSKIEAGKMEIVPQEYNISEMLHELYIMINERAKKKGLILDYRVSPNIPRGLYGDDVRIRQIILNLLTNAVKYTDVGTVKLYIGSEMIAENLVALSVRVKDTGIGMKQEEMDKLFNPFERMDMKKNRTVEGTGLGMSIVTSLLREMGSEIKVDSEYGKGSTFSFIIEQKVTDPVPIGNFDIREGEKGQTGDNEALFTAHKAKVLVVDDTEINLTVARGLLKRTGVQVDTAVSGYQCLELCGKTRYDIILMDHRMPQMDGVETLHALRNESGLNRDTIVIALTANASSDAEEYYLGEGFTGYLSKPIVGTALEKALVKHLPTEMLDTEDDLALAIDEEEGIKACGGREMYMTVVNDGVTNASMTLSELRTLYESGDIKNFTIKVHALKNLARMFGANGLSKEALYLEKCGDEGRTEVLEVQVPKMFEHFEKVVQNLAERHNINLGGGSQEFDVTVFKDMLDAIIEFAGTFDFDNADKVMTDLKEFMIPENMREDFDGLSAALYNYDGEGIVTMAHNCIDKLKG